MHPINFPESNKTLKANPAEKEINDVPVQDLHVLTTCDITGGPVTGVVSCWQITDEDLEQLKETRCVWLHVHAGQSSPPVLVSIDKPFYFPGEPDPILESPVIGTDAREPDRD